MTSRIQPAVLFLYTSFILRAFIVARVVPAVAEDEIDHCPNIKPTPEGWKLQLVGEKHWCCGCPPGYKYVRPCIKNKYNTTVCEICEDGTYLDETAHVQTECIPYPTKPTTTTTTTTKVATTTPTIKPKIPQQTTSLELSNIGMQGDDSTNNTLAIVIAVLSTIIAGVIVYLIWRARKKCLKKGKKTDNVEMETFLGEKHDRQQKTFQDGTTAEKKENGAKNNTPTQEHRHNDKVEEAKLLPKKQNSCTESDRLDEDNSKEEFQPQIRKENMVVDIATDADKPTETKATLPDGDCVTNDGSFNTSKTEPEVLPAEPHPAQNNNTKPKEECNLEETQPMLPALPAGDCSTNSGTPDSSNRSSDGHDLFSQPARTDLHLQVGPNNVEHRGLLWDENTDSVGSPTSPTTIEEPTERLSSIECNDDKVIEDMSAKLSTAISVEKTFDPDLYQEKTSNTKPYLDAAYFTGNGRELSAAAVACDSNALRDSENNTTIVKIRSYLEEIFRFNEGVDLCEEFAEEMAKDYNLPKKKLDKLHETKYPDAGKLLADVIKYIHNTKGSQFRADEIFAYFRRKNHGLLADVVQSRINEHPISTGTKPYLV